MVGNPANQPRAQAEQKTREALERSRGHDASHSGVLTTDDRVLARVTDGIYRQPASALRELVSNAWDADATKVEIKTDWPRFSEIRVSDDGIGMDPSTLAHTLHHIGGSAKRQNIGATLGLTSQTSVERSPSGRPLIGKIGIGLFSVSQLTRSFQIVTKRKGEAYWNIARVLLHTHSDMYAKRSDDDSYIAGQYKTWREPASLAEVQGTTIILDRLWPQTVATLQNKEFWDRYDQAEETGDPIDLPKPPRFNIGGIAASSTEKLRAAESSLPWSSGSSADERMKEFADSLTGLFVRGEENNPSVDQLCDYYLQMVWQLSNWTPVEYIESNPLKATRNDGLEIYDLSDPDSPVELNADETIAERAGITLPRDALGFTATIDGTDIKRPVQLRNYPKTSEALQNALLFVGNGGTEFEGVDLALSGGPVRFHAYILWAPKIVPTENRGLMIRVHDASGTTYDSKFLDFPLAEQRRLQQITCEIFITEGFDGALNIDRESFNESHPHVVYLTHWLHRNLRKVINTQKRLGSVIRRERRTSEVAGLEAQIADVVRSARESRRSIEEIEPIEVAFSEEGVTSTERATYVLDRRKVLGVYSGAGKDVREKQIEIRVAAIVEVLDAYGLIDKLHPRELDDLLRSMRKIIDPEGAADV